MEQVTFFKILIKFHTRSWSAYMKMSIFFKGKTLILEAAAKTLSQREDTEVVFISALGETEAQNF